MNSEETVLVKLHMVKI